MINFKRLLLVATFSLSLFFSPAVFADFNSDKAEILALLAEGQAVSADLTPAEKERVAERFCAPQIKPLIISQITSANTELLIWSLGSMSMAEIKGLAAAAKAELASLGLPNSAEYLLLVATLDQVIAFPGTVPQLQAVLLANEPIITAASLTATNDFIDYACAETGYTTLIQLGDDSAAFLTAQSANIVGIITAAQGTTTEGPIFAGKVLSGLKLSRNLYLSSIGNRVWIDANGNGILEDGTNGSTDLGEVGIDGVTVELLDGADAVIDTAVTYTGANNGKLGYYRFNNLMASRFPTASDYKIRVVLPSGYIITTKAGAGIADDNLSDANIADSTTDAITLEYADTMNQIDIGIMDPEGPVITEVTTADPANYTIGDTISFEVTFDQIVDVAGGVPKLKFKAPDNLTVKAEYVSGTGTDTLVFEYTFTAADNINDWDGIEVPAKNLVKGGATIENSTDDEANYMVPATDFAGIKIDTAIPEWDKVEITSAEGVVIGNIRYLPDGASITSFLYITENDTREEASVGLSIGGAAEQVVNTSTSDTGHDKDAQKVGTFTGLGEVALGDTFIWIDFAGNEATGTPTFAVNDSDPAVDTYVMGPVPAIPTEPVTEVLSPVLAAGNGNPHNTFGSYTTPQEWNDFGNRLRFGVRPAVLTYINRNGFEVFRGYRYGILGWDRPTTKRFQNQVRYRASYHERERGLALNNKKFAETETLSERIHTMQETYQKDFAPMEYKSEEFKKDVAEFKALARRTPENAYKGTLARKAQKKVNKWERKSPFGKIIRKDPYARNMKVIKMRLPNGKLIRIERVMK